MEIYKCFVDFVSEAISRALYLPVDPMTKTCLT